MKAVELQQLAKEKKIKKIIESIKNMNWKKYLILKKVILLFLKNIAMEKLSFQNQCWQ